MRFILYAGISALIIYILPSRPQRNILQLCITRANKPTIHLLLEHIYFHGWPAWLTAHQKYCYLWKIRENTNDKIIAIFIQYNKPNIIFSSSKICRHWSGLRKKLSAWPQMCPGKRNFCFFPVTFAKVLPLAVIFRFFCGYFCNFPTFFENFVSAWQTKSVWLPAPRIHLSPALSLFSKYAPIVLQTPPLIVLHFQVLLSTPVWPTWPDRCSLTRDDNYSRTFHICKW